MADFADGDPVYADVFERLDLHEDEERCGPPDPDLFEPLPDRYFVSYREPPGAEDLALLGGVARIMWVFRQLRLIEVETKQAEAISTLPGVVGVVTALKSVGSTRKLAVGLNALCTFASRQAADDDAAYRHPAGVGYPVLRDGTLDLDRECELPTPPALIPVVNMSLGTTTVGHPSVAGDIVNLATLGASSEVLVVVAAGNCGDYGADSMSAWAQPEWVLSVGATDDADGRQLASYSGRGSPGPDLVALGRSQLDENRRGTSFAAPRVTHLAKLVVTAFAELGREVRLAQGMDPTGVPAVGYALIDGFGDELWWGREEATGWQALPLLGTHRDVVAEIVGLTGPALTIRTTPQIVREVLVDAARPIPGAEPSEAGAGFVDSDIVIDHLTAMTGAELWDRFGTGPSPDRGQLAALRPFAASELRDLDTVVGTTGPTVKFDHKTGRWAALPPLDPPWPQQHPYGWEVDLAGIRM
jgi:hypothetical protein